MDFTELRMITDLLGREVQFKYDTPLIFIYKNGVVKREYFTK